MTDGYNTPPASVDGGKGRLTVQNFDRRLFEAICLLLELVILSTLAMAWAEGWRLIDAFCFSVMMLTPVGDVALAPQTAAGKLLFAMFICAGYLLLAWIAKLTWKYLSAD